MERYTSETYLDQPWYSYGEPYGSNNPLDIALADQYNNSFYSNIDDYMSSRNASRCARAYPRAPGGKNTLENFYDMPLKKKQMEMMTKKPRRHMIRQENLIPFNAYHKFQKVHVPQNEHLIPFNAYSGYQKNSLKK